MAKRSAKEVFQDNYRALKLSLPMTNAKFLVNLYKHISIDENFKLKLESQTERKERTSYFLDHIIRPQISVGDNTSFVKLLTVMKTCNYDNVKHLAEDIEAQCTLNIKSTVIDHEPPTTDVEKIRHSVQSLKSRPSLQDLTKLVTPQYAAKWRVIGSLLGLGSSEIEIIEHDHGHNAINCCSQMWGKWLDRDISASWNDILNVLEHKSVIQTKIIIPADNEAKENPFYSVEELKKKSKKSNAQNMVVNYSKLGEQQKKLFDDVQAMIIVVNQNEFMATMCYLKPPNELSVILEVHGNNEIGFANKQFIFYIGMFGKCPVAVTRVEQGRGRDAIDHIKCFKNILLIAAVGVAAGFPENKVHYGDVIISKQIKDCSIYRQEDGTCTPRGDITPGCKYMIDRLQNSLHWEFVRSKQGTKSSIILGLFLSKPVLLDSKKGRAEMLRDFGIDAKGFEMEGFSITGFGIECIIIKGVCDYASGKTKEWQPTAALAANDYLYHHLNQTDISSMRTARDDIHKDKKFLPKLDINHLMNIVRFVQEKWQVIGLNLRVPKERLDWISKEADRENIPLQSLDTFCCIKMLTYWFQNNDNVSANAIIEVIKAPHVGLKDKIPSILEALTSSTVDFKLVKTTKKFATSPPESHEMPYIEMKTDVCNAFEESQCSINGVLLYLQNTNVDPAILENISSFPDLFKSFEAHDLLHAGDPAWLKTIAKYAKCPKALEVIKTYSRLLIADKTICSYDSFNKPKNGFVAKFSDRTLENFTVKDCSETKAAVGKILDLNETDGILDHSELGSLTFYWRVKENITITIPKFTCPSLIKNCKDNGITHIGTITDGNLQLVNISELDMDEFTGNQIEKGIEYLEKQYEYIILGRSEHEEWPPDQPNVYTINILIYHKEKFISNDVLKVCKITRHNYKEKNTQNAHSYANDDQCRNISDIFVPVEAEYSSKSPKTILIEGDPGIGKTMLANQIALQWKNINLLCNKIFLFLIYLRDPKVHEIHTIHDLLKYMFRDDKLEDYDTCIHTYENLINKTNGSCLALLFDGYDELSKEKRKNSFVSKIINREILKECLLVITSRPFGSEDLHCYACRRIKLLGFTEEDRIVQLKESLKNPQKFNRLMQYLKDHPTINSLCYNSLNMTMFLYLFKQSDHGHLPASQTELFDMFISQTVTHFLNKHRNIYTFNFLSQFKGIHGSILKELGELSFRSLCKDKMVFSSYDLKNDCPKYFSFTSENSCSYGLLKEKRRLCTVDKSYNFLHLTIQEYLAAWHLSNFNILHQLSLNSTFHTYFWEHRFFNVWVLYIGITKGQKFGFRHFISGNTIFQTLFYRGAKRLSPEMLHDKFKSMYLFQCCKESGDIEICRRLGLLLENEVIDLKDHQMSPQNINTLCFVLTFQCTLKELNLSNCDIGDTGCKRFCEDMIEAGLSNKVWIKTLTLSSNQLTTSSVDLLIDLTCTIRIQNLIICNNQLLDRDAELLCRKCKNLKFLCLEDENILRPDQILTNLFYDTDKPCISIAIKESVCLQQTSFTLPTYVNPHLIKSLYVDCSSSSNNNNLKQVMQKLSLLKFHAIVKLNQSKEVVSLIMKMNTIKELYVSQLNDESYDLMINFIEKSNIVSYALTSFSRFEAKNVDNAKVINSALQKCCTFQSVTNLILHNCRFCTEDLTATIANKTHWNMVILTECGIDVSELSCLYEYFYPRIDTFKLN